MQSQKALADSTHSAFPPDDDDHTRRRAAVFDVSPVNPAALEPAPGCTTLPEPLRRWQADLGATTAAHAPSADPRANAHDYVGAVLGAAAGDLAAVRRALDTLVACVVAHHMPVDLTSERVRAGSDILVTVPGNPSGGNALRAVRERRLNQQQRGDHNLQQQQHTQQTQPQQQPVHARSLAQFELPAPAVPASTMCLSTGDGGAFTPSVSFSGATEQHSRGASDAARHVDACEITVTAAGGVDLDASADTASEDLNQYVLLERLGKGAQGTVFLALDTVKDELRAIKAVERPPPGARVSPARRKAQEDLAREVAIMKRLRHRNIVALHEVIDDPAQDALFLVLQYVEHGAVAAMAPDGSCSRTVDPRLLAHYAQQLCAGLHHLHRNGVIHRDIKPENILVGMNDKVLLADLGMSEAFDDGVAHREVTGTRGTPAFLAPELLRIGLEAQDDAASPFATPDASNGRCVPSTACHVAGEPVDVWALGITLYALLYGKLPWEFTDARDLFEAIQRRPIELRPLALSTSASAGSVRRRPTPPPAGDPGTAGSVRRMRTELSIDSSESAAMDPSLSASATAYVASRGPLSMSTNSLPTTTPANIDAAWRRVLSGMLQRDPAKRSSVGRVRRQLAAMAHELEQPAAAATVDGAAPDNAITSLK